MFRATLTALLCWAFLLAQSYGQDVFVPRELKAIPVSRVKKEGVQSAKKETSPSDSISAKRAVTGEAAKSAGGAESVTNLRPEKAPAVKTETAKTAAAKEATAKEPATNLHPDKVKTEKSALANAPAKETAANSRPDKQPQKTESVQEPPTQSTAKSNLDKTGSVKTDPAKAAAQKDPGVNHGREAEKVRATRAESVDVPTTKTRAEELNPEKGRAA